MRCSKLVIELICCSTDVKRSLKVFNCSRTVICPPRDRLEEGTVRYRDREWFARDETIVSRDVGILPSVESSLLKIEEFENWFSRIEFLLITFGGDLSVWSSRLDYLRRFAWLIRSYHLASWPPWCDEKIILRNRIDIKWLLGIFDAQQRTSSVASLELLVWIFPVTFTNNIRLQNSSYISRSKTHWSIPVL